MAEIIDSSFENLFKCADFLHSGGLVAFPTETVYGLGASLWHENALNTIFIAKSRPKTDPLIVHIQKKEDAKNLVILTQKEQTYFDILAKKFWPGPLTIVLKAEKHVPKIVMSGGNYVGVRVPAHPIAQKLLAFTNAPIAAPSANKFGHVSPTTAQHVFDDLSTVSELLIINDDTKCDIGIESTVIKIQDETIQILRLGAISEESIKAELRMSNMEAVLIEQKKYLKNEHDIEKREEKQNVSRETFLEDAPGQNLTHYSPWIETYVIYDSKNGAPSLFPILHKQKISDAELKNIAIVDFGKKYFQYKNLSKIYYDLSEDSDYKTAARNLFNIMREIENKQDVEKILIANLYSESPFSKAIFDRIYRAASGKFIEF